MSQCAVVVPHLKFTLLDNRCLIQNDTIEGTVGRRNQHHPVFFPWHLVVTKLRNQSPAFEVHALSRKNQVQ